MRARSDLGPVGPAEVLDYLKSQENKTLLRFLTCGSVDDGKSTLDRPPAVRFKAPVRRPARRAQRHRPTGWQRRTRKSLDLASLVDGLQAEREQGITIDVAYRFFAPPTKRKFIVADTPGHEQYNPQHGDRRLDLRISP